MSVPLSTAAWRRRRGQVASYILILPVVAFFVVPIVWLFFEAIGGNLGLWLFNSLFYSTAGAAIAVATCIPAGYGLASHEFPGRRPLLVLTVLVMLIPTTALVLPLFLEANSAHLLTSPLAVILPYGLFPFGVYLSYLYFNTERFAALVADRPPRRLRRMAAVLARRRPPRVAGHGADRVPQLRRELDELLPAVGHVLVVGHDEALSPLARNRATTLRP